MELIKKRLANLLSVKSLVTLASTLVFGALAAAGRLSAQEFLTVYTVIVSFYFGTQHERNGGKSA